MGCYLAKFPKSVVDAATHDVLSPFSDGKTHLLKTVVNDLPPDRYPPGLVPRVLMNIILRGRLRRVPGGAYDHPEFMLSEEATKQKEPREPRPPRPKPERTSAFAFGTKRRIKWDCPRCKHRNLLIYGRGTRRRKYFVETRCRKCNVTIHVRGVVALEKGLVLKKPAPVTSPGTVPVSGAVPAPAL